MTFPYSLFVSVNYSVANQMLYLLSYLGFFNLLGQKVSNLQPSPYQRDALTNCAMPQFLINSHVDSAASTCCLEMCSYPFLLHQDSDERNHAVAISVLSSTFSNLFIKSLSKFATSDSCLMICIMAGLSFAATPRILLRQPSSISSYLR